MKLGAFTRRTAAQGVLLAWAVALAWLARRELGKTEAETIAEATVRLNPDAYFYAVTAGDTQVGYASTTIDTIATGFRFSQVLALDVPADDSVRRVTRRTEIALSRSLRLIGFVRTVSGSGLFEELRGTIEGDTLLRLAQRDGREESRDEWAIRTSGDVVLSEILPYRLAFAKRLGVGQAASANVLDLTTGTINRLDVTATAESTFVVADSAVELRATRLWQPVRYDTVTAWRIEHTAAGAPEIVWVDDNGNLVRSETPLGVRLTRSAFELVSTNYRVALDRRGASDHRAVPAMRSVLEAGLRLPRTETAGYRIGARGTDSLAAARAAWLAGGRQSAAGSRVMIGTGKTGADSAKRGFLDPAAQLRPVAPSVAALAATIAPEARGAAAVAQLTEWVHREIRLDRDADAPRAASRVLATRQAGAEGMATLLADLARARGLTARIVGGVAVIGGATYGHTWTEVLLDDAWVAIDPTFGQIPASAALIRITSGSPGRAIDLVPLIGAAVLEPISPDAER